MTLCQIATKARLGHARNNDANKTGLRKVKKKNGKVAEEKYVLAFYAYCTTVKHDHNIRESVNGYVCEMVTS